MRLEFQKNIASSQFTLPLVSIIALLIWIILPATHSAALTAEHYGLWALLPEAPLHHSIGKIISILLTMSGGYLIAELTIANVLLRISSRLLSSSFVLLMGVALCLHTPTPGHVVMLFTLLSYFALFQTYQNGNPAPVFIAYLMLSTGSLVFPKLLYLVPVYWGCRFYLRAFGLRSLLASVFGVLMPYWFFFSFSLYSDAGIQLFANTCHQLISLNPPEYSLLRFTDILIFALVLVFFVAGAVNFHFTAYLDKTRVRILYNLIITHGISVTLFLLIQPQHLLALLPVMIIDASLVGGHYIALTYNKFSSIYCIIMLVSMLALLATQIIL